MRPRAEVPQSCQPMGLISAYPLGGGLGAHVEAGRGQLQRASLQKNFSGQLLSTMNRQSGILVIVHSISPKVLVARHNQLLRFHSNGQPLETSQVALDKVEDISSMRTAQFRLPPIATECHEVHRRLVMRHPTSPLAREWNHYPALAKLGRGTPVHESTDLKFRAGHPPVIPLTFLDSYRTVSLQHPFGGDVSPLLPLRSSVVSPDAARPSRRTACGYSGSISFLRLVLIVFRVILGARVWKEPIPTKNKSNHLGQHY